jgi:uncharacterized membrane protein
MKNFFQNIVALILGIGIIATVVYFLIFLPIWKGSNSYDPDGSIAYHSKGTSFINAVGITVIIVVVIIVLFFLYLEKTHKTNKQTKAIPDIINERTQKRIQDIFPEFVKENLWNKTITISTTDKLLMTNYDQGEELSMGIEYNRDLDTYHLISEFKDKFKNHLIGDKIEIGSLNCISQNPIDWSGYEGYNDAMLSNIVIEQIMLEFSNTPKLDTSLIRFDGLYYIENGSRAGTTDVLRFYEDNTILNIESPTFPIAKKNWLNKTTKNANSGKYVVKNNFIVGKMNKINSAKYRFTVSYLTMDHELFTRFYGRIDCSLKFLPFATADFDKISSEDFEIIIDTLGSPYKMIVTDKNNHETVTLKLLGFTWLTQRTDDKICTFKAEPSDENPFSSDHFDLSELQFDTYCNDAVRIKDRMDKLLNL